LSLQRALLDEISKAIKLPANLELLVFYHKPKDSNELIPEYPMALEKNIAVDGTDIKETTVNHDEYGQIVVAFKTTSDGATKFAKATAPENKGKKLAIVLDHKIRNAPNINEPITTGSGQISGGFTYEEAITLSRIIKEGALPVDLQIISENVTGPSLGQDSINAGVKALLVSLISIMFFLIIYYKAAGVIAVVGLFMNFLFMVAILSLLGFTLTLPGIAGFILTVGMSIDANVIIYERIKEELAGGKSIRMAVVNGYEKAFTTIIDSNLTTIITTFILFQFGTGPIKGFAVTLIVGVLTSMFAALYITRFFYEVISHSKRIKKLSI
jgi:preprotein translocase subunit SecD